MRKSAIVKATFAGVTALAIAGSTLVYAQQRDGRFDGQQRRWQPTTEDVAAFADARLAGLKAGLALSAEQEKNWPAYEKARRDFSAQRLERRAAMRTAPRPADPVERMKAQADAMAAMAASIKSLADATEPLYTSLDDAQKRRFAMLSRSGPQMGQGRDHHRGHHWRGRDRDRDGGPRQFERFRRGSLEGQPFEDAPPTQL